MNNNYSLIEELVFTFISLKCLITYLSGIERMGRVLTIAVGCLLKNDAESVVGLLSPYAAI